jgi:hypothetical protein
MEFGDKIKDLPTDEQTPESIDKQLLIDILKPEEPSKFSSASHNIRLVAIAVILYFVLNTTVTKNFLLKYISNPDTLKYLIFVFIALSLYLYHTYI